MARRGDDVRGRDAEWGVVSGVLDGAGKDRGGVVLVEGEPGFGKSLLLAEAGRAAHAAGYALVTAVADELERLIPLCSLRVALDLPTAVPAADKSRVDDPDPWMHLLGAVRQRLEDLLVSAPVLVTVDDLQYADPVTLLALRMLPRMLAARPLVWVLARTAGHGSDVARLFDMLANDGAVCIRLQALPDTAIADHVADVVGAIPDDALLSLAAGSGGNPFMLNELLQGLKEENALRIAAGHATLVSDRVPARFQVLIRREVETLMPATRQLLETTTVLGQSFALEDAAELLGQRPTGLLPAVEEALAARFLITDGDLLSFSHALIWHAIADTMPRSVTRAVHRQYGEILLDRGGSALQAAEHLAKGARRGDRRALYGLDQAARAVLSTSPRTAADLAVRVLELTDPADPASINRSVRAAQALVSARRLKEARSLIDATLAGPLPLVPRSRLRCTLASILSLTGQPVQARAEAESVLAEPYLPRRARDEATVTLLQALVALPDLREADETATAILAAHEGSADTVTVAATATRATVEWNEAHLAESLNLSYQAVFTEVKGKPPDCRKFRPELDLASRLVDIRQFDAATALIGAPPGESDATDLTPAQARPTLLQARMHLAAGDLDHAARAAQAVIGADQSVGPGPYTTQAHCLLGAIALRRGDLNAAEHCVDQLSALPDEARSGHAGITCSVLTAQVTAVRDGAAPALDQITGIYDDIRKYLWLLIGDPATAPWLARLALAARDRGRAAKIGAAADDLGRANPDFPAVTAACAHAVGLLERDTRLLRQAVETQTDGWAKASAAEDLGVLLGSRTPVPEAIAYLRQALEGYEMSGAVRDTIRLRGRLRRLGVIRRPRKVTGRPAQGWASLTETERTIASLVAQGLTNRRIADEMFVSVHTVAFHLRHIFRKLSVASRVELARAVLTSQENSRPEGGGKADLPVPPDADGTA
jgi:DNA-binding CsgD family transcriptional regulator/tetratricopeptide (TPR) repeat protein